MEIKLNHLHINTLDNGSEIYVIPMSKEVYEEFAHDFSNLTNQVAINKFANKYGFTYKDVILDGNTYINVNDHDEVESVKPILARILPKPVTVNNPLTEKRELSYKCYCYEGLNIESVVEHKTPIESWNCLMIHIGEPEFALVLEIKKE